MWDDIIVDGWHYRVFQGESGYIGLAKKEPFVNGDPIQEPGDLWFQFGISRDEALERIQNEIRLLKDSA